MSILKTHRHKTNIAIVALTSLYVIGTAVELSTPYWVSSTSILAPIAVFAATPLGISVLAFAAVALASLAIYSMTKTRVVSIIKKTGDLFVKVKDEDFEYIKKHNRNKNPDGSIITNEYLIYFSLESKSYYITATSKEMNNNDGLLKINSLGRKNDKGEYELIHEEKSKTLGFSTEENDPKELIIRLVPSSIVKSPEAEQQKKDRSLPS